jgi:hypothetical protein
MSIPPYDEQDVLAYCEVIRAAYREAQYDLDWAYPVWPSRAMYDYATGALSWDASCAKHLRECRDALGLTPPPPPPQTLERLRVNGHVFETETGHPFTAIQCSDFNLLNRWQHGEHIRPVLEQRAGCGFNLLRVWTLYDLVAANIGQFLDIDYARIPAFLQLCANYGFYVEFTAYTSTEHYDHWGKLVAACRAPFPVLLELVNEGTIPVNQIDMSRYARPAGILASHGSGGAEGVPPWDPWDYGTLHYNDADQWQRKTAHNPMEDFANVHHRPAMANENTRYPDHDTSLAHAYDAAAGAALLTAGACYHSCSGKSSVLWAGVELDAARAWAEGARSMPLEFQHGQYIRRDDLLTPELLRVYERRLADGRGHIVKIRK